MTAQQRAKELAQFFGIPEHEALEKLNRGFGWHHARVTEDWHRANPQTDDEILEWYRTTDSYIWELSAYHLDGGFNYMGQIAGVSEALRAKSVNRVLCLGDGIGDLTLRLAHDGFMATYHDLDGSKTAQFAIERLHRSLDPWRMKVETNLTTGWAPFNCPEGQGYDGIVSLDFIEHLTLVEDWVKRIYEALNPGGWLCAQNAFACGSGPDGSIPCHLERNDRFEKDWDPTLAAIGFVQESSNWYRKPL